MDSSTLQNSDSVLSQLGSQSQKSSNADTVSLQTPATVTIENAKVASPASSNAPTPASVPTVTSSQTYSATTANSHTSKAAQSTTSNQANAINHDQILTRTRLQDLVKEIDPCEQLDEEVEDLLLQLIDDFVTSTVNTACAFAKHRNANTVEVRDVQLYLEKVYNMWIPGFGTEEVKPYKKPPITDAHKQRLALIRKSLRKY